jgi:dTMP kinase
VSGLFITIEGGEGVGKSTQARLLADRLRHLGASVLQPREPGGTPVGDRIRDLLLEPGVEMVPRTELFLYEASRAELMTRVIVPALERGEVVVCDRFFDSTTAYQAFGRGLDPASVQALNLYATGDARPDITVLLTLDLDEAMRRATRGGADRIESESLEFHRRVIEGFEALAADDPGRFRSVDAVGTPDEVGSRLWDALRRHPAFVCVFGEQGAQ